MPLYKTLNPNSKTTVKIWKITESFNDLMTITTLNPANLQRVLKMKSALHQCGFLSVRCLLAEFGYSDADLFYDENGKPHLKNGKHISITHSFTFSVVIVSDNEVGIDIEMQREKIGVIAYKFMDYESQYLQHQDEDYIRKLTVIWCIKESLYKLFATPGLSFLKHTLVIPFTMDDETTIAWIDYENRKCRYHATFFEFEGFSCAYTLPF